MPSITRAALLALSFASLLAAPLAVPLAAHEYRAGEVAIVHPWSRPALESGTGAGFMTLRNPGAAADRLVSASSPAARAVEIHEQVRDGDVLRMRPVEGIAVPAGGEAVLAPGGFHLMLVGLNRPLRAGDRVPLTLRFERGGTVAVELAVEATNRAAAPGPAHAH